MASKNYTVHCLVLLGSFAAISWLTYLLVDHHLGIPARVAPARTILLASGQSVTERIRPVGKVSLEAAELRVLPAGVAVAATTPRDGAQVYALSCAACHGGGIAGAPKLGDKAQWQARVGKGTGVLYANALNGTQTAAGVMPAKGGNPGLSETELRGAVDFMLAKLK